MNCSQLTITVIELAHKKKLEYGWQKYLFLSWEEGKKVTAVFVRDIRKRFNNIPVHFRFQEKRFGHEYGILEVGKDKIYIEIDNYGGVRPIYTIN